MTGARWLVADAARAFEQHAQTLYYLTNALNQLPEPERAELLAILEAALDEAGYLDHRRLTPD